MTSLASRRDAGSATAETAVVLPALVLILALCVWVISLLATQLRCIEAVRAGARAAARGESTSAVEERVHEAIGRRGDVDVVVREDDVVVRVRLTRSPSGVLARLLPDVTLSAEATAHREPGEGEGR